MEEEIAASAAPAPAPAPAPAKRTQPNSDAFNKMFRQMGKYEGVYRSVPASSDTPSGGSGAGVVVISDPARFGPFSCFADLKMHGYTFSCPAQLAMAMACYGVAGDEAFPFAKNIGMAISGVSKRNVENDPSEMRKRVEAAISRWKSSYAKRESLDKEGAADLWARFFSKRWSTLVSVWLHRALVEASSASAELREFLEEIGDSAVVWGMCGPIPGLFVTNSRMGSTQFCRVDKWDLPNAIGVAYHSASKWVREGKGKEWPIRAELPIPAASGEAPPRPKKAPSKPKPKPKPKPAEPPKVEAPQKRDRVEDDDDDDDDEEGEEEEEEEGEEEEGEHDAEMEDEEEEEEGGEDEDEEEGEGEEEEEEDSDME